MIRARLICILFIVTIFFSCNYFHKEQNTAKYGFISCLDPETQESERYFESTSLKTGNLTAEKPANDLSAIVFSYKNGSYFGIDYQSDDLVRFQSEEGVLTEKGRLHLDKNKVWHKTSSWFNWIGRDTLLLGSSMSGKHFEYCLVNTIDMKLTRKGHLDIPLPSKGLNYGGIFGYLKNNKLYVAYTIYDYWNPAKPAPSDTTYLATISYPAMKTESITKDARSTFPGGYLLAWQFGLTYKNDLYLITQTGGRTREHPTSPNVVFKIKDQQQHIDPTYLFTVAEKKKEEAYGLYDLGDGLAITKVIQKAAIGETMDYMNKNVAQYFLVDLVHQTRTKLNLPPDILDFRRNILRIRNELFISIYDSAAHHSVVWTVDIHTLKTTKGLIVPGHVLQIFRINLEQV